MKMRNLYFKKDVGSACQHRHREKTVTSIWLGEHTRKKRGERVMGKGRDEGLEKGG